MKKFLFYLLSACFSMNVCAQKTITVEVKGIRSNQGNILVMAKSDGSDQPAFGMAKAQKGTVSIVLNAIEGEKADVSIFHDENSNRQLDKDATGKPAEGCAVKSVSLKEEHTQCKVSLYYPAGNE